ncbi:4Fe-4S dicluster domain-containing protein [Desulfitobacterium sp. AusDCA]|uniref:4Fe-4S dicluster domain-containing protein n=1 Tax=Desulfitobacterium sp. AusDCA TaxID=3240383 RepID=UPI003DA759A1
MLQWFFVFNPNQCIGCLNCVSICKLEHGAENRRVELSDSNNYFISQSCNHCESPECFRVCRERSYFKRRDGIVIHNEKKCSGCGDCIRACPFKAPRYSFVTGKVTKCDFCYEKIDSGLEPDCVRVCPTHALTVSQGEPVESVKLIDGFPDVFFTHPKIRFKI